MKKYRFSGFNKISQHPALQKSRHTYAKQEFATPFFVLRETLAGIARHNIMGLSASLSFYALFALIPLMLLIFFLLSHLVYTSDYAIVQLAILSSNLLPDFSNKIMEEVYKTTQTGAAWGVLGLLFLLWSVTPLASAMRTAFYEIASTSQPPSFLKRKVKDILSVLGILLLFLLFSAAGFLIETIVGFLTQHLSEFQLESIVYVSTLALTTLLIALFYRAFFPLRVAFIHLLIGSFVTALLWLTMRPAFTLFLSLNQNFGAVFGSMKTMFVSIIWLYLNFAAFLLGTEVIATLRKKDTLLLKRLFDNKPDKNNYIEALMQRYGITRQQNEYIFKTGNQERKLYYLVTGEVTLNQNNVPIRTINAGNYFGETASLTAKPTLFDAIVTSEQARIIVIQGENIDAILTENPEISLHLLKQLAARLENSKH